MYYNNLTLFQTENYKFSIPVCFRENNNIIKIFGKHHGDKKIINFPKNINIITIEENCFFLHFTQSNVAHSICQFIKSLYDYSKLTNIIKLYVSEIINKMPFLQKLIKLLFKVTDFKIINLNTNYNFKYIYIPEYIWFTNEIPYNLKYDNKIRIYDTNIPLSEHHGILYEPLVYFNNCIEEIYNIYKNNYQIFDNIIIIKSNLCSDSTTPKRQIFIDNKCLELINNNNFKIILPHTITDIIEHIVILRSAKNIITSYGGANCINRFFFSPNSIVKVICNQSYEDEYKHEWHNKISIYNTNKYILFLDIPNKLNYIILNSIIKY